MLRRYRKSLYLFIQLHSKMWIVKLHNFIFPAQQSSQAEKWEFFVKTNLTDKSRFVKNVSGKVCWIWVFWVYNKTETHHWNFALTISSVLQIQFHRKDKLCVMIVLVDLPAECARILYFFYLNTGRPTYWGTPDPK